MSAGILLQANPTVYALRSAGEGTGGTYTRLLRTMPRPHTIST
jgi:hypothetical protein